MDQPEPEPVLRARFLLDVNGSTIELVRPVINRFIDNVRGELTRNFAIVPPVSLHIPEPTVLFTSAGPRDITVEVKALTPGASGTVTLAISGNEWKVEPASRPFQLSKQGEQAIVMFKAVPPGRPSIVQASAQATVDGRESSLDVLPLNYSHISQTIVLDRASSRLARSDIQVLAKKVGYVPGAGDEVPEALRQMGCEVSVISSDELARADLSGYDAIVTGVRVYNLRADVRANHQRLLDYVSAGGTLVVQYNVVEGGAVGNDSTKLDQLGPYLLQLGRERVTVEEAPIEFLKSDHPLLNAPNKITAADFEGWVQERGLYFPTKWDPRYETVIASNDPGGKPLPGGTLYTRYGKGAYVYTAYSWFRQLPAGVPGAYRLFANMLSAGKAK